MLVMKFGGTSIGSAERLQAVADLIKRVSAERGAPVVVLSAMSGITNTLIAGAELAAKKNPTGAMEKLESVRARHNQAAAELFPSQPEARAQLQGVIDAKLAIPSTLYSDIRNHGVITPQSLDAVSGAGELLSSELLAALLDARGIRAALLDARQFMITDDSHGKACPLWDEMTSRVRKLFLPLLDQGTVCVTQGFIGATASGATTTLGRGGSDFSASIIGVALDAEEIQIWTDVDGMMTADPRLIPEAKVLREVSFQEASELAYFGAKVLHPLTIKPAIEKKIPVRVLNTLNLSHSGTLISPAARPTEMVRAIAFKKGITAVLVSSPKILMTHGYMVKIFAVFDHYKTPIDLISTSEISVALTVDDTSHLNEITSELSEMGDVETIPNTAIITVVGSSFRNHNGIAARILDTLRDVNILMISFGGSAINLSLVVADQDAERAVRALHGSFFGGGSIPESASAPALPPALQAVN